MLQKRNSLIIYFSQDSYMEYSSLAHTACYLLFCTYLSLIRSSKVNLVSILTPKSFSQLLLFINEFLILISVKSLELMIQLNLPVFPFIWLSENHLKSFSNDCCNMQWRHQCYSCFVDCVIISITCKISIFNNKK